MASGPEHYQKAERMLREVEERGRSVSFESAQATLLAAQVHATLALTASNALRGDARAIEHRMPEWRGVTA